MRFTVQKTERRLKNESMDFDFVCMFSMPLLVAVLHFRMRKGQILKIRQDYVKNARYFGRSFSSLVEKALPEMKNGMIMLSKTGKGVGNRWKTGVCAA